MKYFLILIFSLLILSSCTQEVNTPDLEEKIFSNSYICLINDTSLEIEALLRLIIINN